jgi:hypothetical protein
VSRHRTLTGADLAPAAFAVLLDVFWHPVVPPRRTLPGEFVPQSLSTEIRTTLRDHIVDILLGRAFYEVR